MKNNNNILYNKLREGNPFFVYESFFVKKNKYDITITFHFNLSDKYYFNPSLKFNSGNFFNSDSISDESLNTLAFHLGMIELISYWKAACSPTLIIKPYKLNSEQTLWWKNLYFHGLGEFFYTNSLSPSVEDFITIVCKSEKSFAPVSSTSVKEKIIVPIGGGKDSAVTLELLKKSGKEIIPFALNPRKAITNTIESAKISLQNLMVVERKFDTKLLELNAKGFLNGHTPFSALLAFTTLTAAFLIGAKHIALSNEASANEATIPGTKINHQYSKSYEFENDFRSYYTKYISANFNYFSFLRPLNELQIGALFSKLTNHHYTFRSCNIGSKTDSWCGKCSKCLFTNIILSPFLSREKLFKIFGKEILDEQELIEDFYKLTGIANEKPFECVGTIDDVNAALQMTSEREMKTTPLLLQKFKNSDITIDNAQKLLSSFNEEHFLNKELFTILKTELDDFTS
ncbi:MAG: hypothetical protein U9R32_11250 [Bacteroidota bacterium]|nr:hypothetical protein [Bacteroidota bacterium]